MVVAVVAMALGSVMSAPAAAQPPPEGVLTSVRDVAATAQGTCALLGDHRVVCWGSDGSGQRGDGPPTGDALHPVPVLDAAGIEPLGDVAQLAAGESHVCALTWHGEIWCWGRNQRGQLGDGTRDDRELPVQVTGIDPAALDNGMATIAAGGATTCVIQRPQGILRCWGRINASATPKVIRNAAGTAPLHPVVAAGVGDGHVCAVLDGGQARCRGANHFGQLGNGTQDLSLRPVVVKNGSGSGPLRRGLRIAGGSLHTCAVLETSQVRCWGAGAGGRLGYGGGRPQWLPVPVMVQGAVRQRLGGVVSVHPSTLHTCALSLRRAWCWGVNSFGNLGDGTLDDHARAAPVSLPDGAGRLWDLAVGSAHGCVIVESRRLWCWGDNARGQLGDGTTTDRLEPVPVTLS